MPFKIQRTPQGLGQLLSLFGGQTPTDIEDRVRVTLDTLQMYGLQQRQLLTATNAALAEGTSLLISQVSVAQQSLTQRWAVLFGAQMTVTKTATMTALRASVGLIRAGGASFALAQEECGPFGATETGVINVPFVAPYPMILVPPWDIVGLLPIIGTDANANATVACEVGILG